MRILHTADWHVGQTLNGWTREAEHTLWFAALADLVAVEAVDVLLVAGDVFDGINPSGAAQRVLYRALRALKDRRPSLVTIITSGNHDPAARLAAPAAVLEALDVHVVASVARHADGSPDVARHMFPLTGGDGATQAWVCAIPFLRAADLPGAGLGDGAGVVEAARLFHAGMAEGAAAIASGLPVLAMGHLHCRGATESEGAERHILIGGEHALPAEVFPPAFSYVALGHLHRPQDLDGGRIRYSGSCFPLSAAEIGYEHGVTLLDLEDGRIERRHVPLPRPVPVLRLPQSGRDLAALAADLAGLGLAADLPAELRPFVYVTLEAEGPAAVTLTEAEAELARHPVRAAGLRIRRPDAVADAAPPPPSLGETSPEALFRAAFAAANGTEPEPRHLAAFRDALSEV